LQKTLFSLRIGDGDYVAKNLNTFNMFSLRTGDGDYVSKNLNTFNTIVTQLISIGVNMDEEDHCMTFFFSLSGLWDNLVMAIGSTFNALVLDEVMATLISKEMKNTTSKSTNEALIIQGRSKKKGKNKENDRF
jgi:hypothetical protein